MAKNGGGCQGGASDCFDKLKIDKGDLKVSVLDIKTRKPIKGASVVVFEKFTTTENKLTTGKSDGSGHFSYGSKDYGYYLVKVTKDGYEIGSQNIYHRNSSDKHRIMLSPISNMPMVVQLASEDPKNPQDLLLGISSINGKQCVVSAVNKYCAFSQHSSDILKDDKGAERIDVRHLSIAYYLVYVKKEDGSMYQKCS